MSSALEEPVVEQVLYKLKVLLFYWIVKWDLDLSQSS